MNALEIRNLSKHYPGFSLENLNLTLPSGCIMGLVGENGAGKSTTIKLILQMIREDSGTVTLLGRDAAQSLQDIKQDLGVVLDEVGIPGCFTPRHTGRLMARAFSRWNQDTYQRLLARFSLPPDKPFQDFSKGMKMKLGIAIALSHDAKLLILDEATSGLDPVVRDEILDLFMEFTRDEGHSILLSSHIVSDLEKVCDYIAFLHRGRLLLCQEKDRLREEYAIFRCTPADFARIRPADLIGKKETPYGIEALVRRSALPAGTEAGPVDIEQLFIFMAKEEPRP